MKQTLLAVDVHYINKRGITAGVLFHEWDASNAAGIYTSETQVDYDYSPGQFYKRERPCILDLLEKHSLQPDVIIVDGYVFLDGVARPGLGKRLYDVLSPKIPVIGIGKSRFLGISDEYTLLRGESKNPLYVTSVGVDQLTARQCVASMHGKFRIPTLIKMADIACRESAAA